MPCTAKKFEADRPEFKVDGNNDVDIVLTTKELALMIKEAGLEFNRLQPTAFDKPFGVYTGAGVIFGASGGVAEAVLRYAAHKLGAKDLNANSVRGLDGIKITQISLGGVDLKLAVVSGLSNAKKLLAKIKSGEEKVDLIEVMACCGGCVNGGGQPETENTPDVLAQRSKGLYASDKNLASHSSDENPEIQKLYANGGALSDSHKTHDLLHTGYKKREAIEE
jgi:iron only hydrogenase large subunit-like protein